MLKIGDKEVVMTQTMVIPDGETAFFDFSINSEPIQISIVFETNNVPDSERKINWKLEDGILRMTFIGWRNSLGTSLIHPAKIGELNGQPFGFNLMHFLVGTVNLVTFQFYIGGTYNV